MRTYINKSTGADFEIYDYLTENNGPTQDKRFNLCYVGRGSWNFIDSLGWFDTKEEAIFRMLYCAEKFGVKLTGALEERA